MLEGVGSICEKSLVFILIALADHGKDLNREVNWLWLCF